MASTRSVASGQRSTRPARFWSSTVRADGSIPTAHMTGSNPGGMISSG